MRTSTPVLAAALTVALAGGLVACGDEAGPAAGRGRAVVGGTADQLAGAAATAVVPTGSIEVTVGDPVRSVPASQARDAKAHQPPQGYSYLPVHWDYDFSAAPWAGLLALDPQESTVTVRVGKVDKVLGSPYTVGGGAIDDVPGTTFYVPVKGEPAAEEVSVLVEYDGGTQTLDLSTGTSTGEGADLSVLSPEQPPAPACPSQGWTTKPAARATVTCDLSWAGRTPYWPGSGWAGDGEWQVIHVARLQPTELTSPDGADAWTVTGATDATTADGAPAATALSAGPGDPGRLQGTLVFPARPAEPLAVDLAMTAQVTRPDGPAEARLSLTRSFG